MGCGPGNTVFPLLETTPATTRIWACDFSDTAINLVHPPLLLSAAYKGNDRQCWSRFL